MNNVKRFLKKVRVPQLLVGLLLALSLVAGCATENYNPYMPDAGRKTPEEWAARSRRTSIRGRQTQNWEPPATWRLGTVLRSAPSRLNPSPGNTKARHGEPWRAFEGEWLAAVYSPTDDRRKYHRRCRA